MSFEDVKNIFQEKNHLFYSFYVLFFIISFPHF